MNEAAVQNRFVNGSIIFNSYLNLEKVFSVFVNACRAKRSFGSMAMETRAGLRFDGPICFSCGKILALCWKKFHGHIFVDPIRRPKDNN